MDSQESSRFTAPLTQRVAKDADAREIAEAIRAMWVDIESALHPVVGRRGVAALFQRTLHLTATRYPWLSSRRAGSVETDSDLAELAAVFAQQSPAVAMEAGSALFIIFRDLLTTLIGDRLSERLLQAAWSTTSRAASPQDPTP